MTAQPKPTDTELAARVRQLEEKLAQVLTSPGGPVAIPWVCLIDKTGFYGYVPVGGETGLYRMSVQNVTHDGLKVTAPIAVDVGTTARFFLRGIEGSTTETDKLTVVGDGLVHRVEWEWVPEWEDYIGTYESAQVVIYGERTAGAGSYAMGEPWGVCAPANEIDATTSGLGVLIS